MKLRRYLLAALAVGATLYAIEAARTLRPFARIGPRGVEGCRRVEVPGQPALIGAEDMQFDHATGTLWIAAADRRGGHSFRPHDAAIFRWRPDSEPQPSRVPVEGFAAPLRLHGLGLYAPPATPGAEARAERRLFLVQHGEAGESVEIFREDGGVLRHVRSVRDPLFISPNDVEPTGPESFYLTNDHGRPPRLGHVLEDFAFLSNASVVYWDGTAARAVRTGLRYANGVTASADGRFLVVAETTASRLSVFWREADGRLRPAGSTALDTSPDNLSLDEQGGFWVAAHPSNLAFLRHAKDGSRPAPSQVVRFRLSQEGVPTAIETVLLDDGRALSGSSVAAVHGARWLVVGGVFDRGVLLCPRG
ncbi:MAG: SMP-30/gluconolactonase/LRE family protein [Polyangia bacterium]